MKDEDVFVLCLKNNKHSLHVLKSRDFNRQNLTIHSTVCFHCHETYIFKVYKNVVLDIELIERSLNHMRENDLLKEYSIKVKKVMFDMNGIEVRDKFKFLNLKKHADEFGVNWVRLEKRYAARNLNRMLEDEAAKLIDSWVCHVMVAILGGQSSIRLCRMSLRGTNLHGLPIEGIVCVALAIMNQYEGIEVVIEDPDEYGESSVVASIDKDCLIVDSNDHV